MSRPVNCKHYLYPKCGCVEPPALATHLIVERDRKLAEEKAAAEAPKPRGRPRIQWSVQKKQDPDDEFIDKLPTLLEDPYARADLLRAIDRQVCLSSFAEFVQLAWHVVEPTTTLEWNWHHGLICEILQGIFEEWEHAQDDDKYQQKIRNCIMNVPPGSLKPVDENGLVTERDRGVVPLKEIRVGDHVLTHRGRFRKVLAVSEQGKLPVIEFTTGRGRKIRAAKDHPLLTQRGWIEAKDITTRDVFAETHSSEKFGKQTISNEEARMLGYLIGDGCITDKDGVSFTNQDPETVADFMECVRAVGLNPRLKERPPSYPSKTQIVYVNAKGESSLVSVREWVKKHGLSGAKSATKHVPPAVLAGSEEVVLNYLSAYWACDGTIQDRRDLPRTGRNNQLTQSVRVSATTISPKLVVQHQQLLQNLGLSFRVRKKVTRLTTAMVSKNNPRRVGENYTSYDLAASDQDTAAKFIQTISPVMRHEKRTRALGLARTRFDQTLNADNVAEIVDGGTAECRCLQVEEDSSFVYQGVAVHNSKLVNVMFPVWCWLRRPGARFICLSVNQDATMRDARDSRALIRSTWFQDLFQPDWTLKEDQDSVSDYGNTKGGTRQSKPQGSTIVGSRGDFLLIDDANDPEESESKLVRDSVNSTYNTNIHNRINHPMKSVRIGIQQRTHMEDWTGYCTKKHGVWTPENPDPEKWFHVVIPAEFEPSTKCVTPWGSDPRTIKVRACTRSACRGRSSTPNVPGSVPRSTPARCSSVRPWQRVARSR
jgi:intein/homing endonuclease